VGARAGLVGWWAPEPVWSVGGRQSRSGRLVGARPGLVGFGKEKKYPVILSLFQPSQQPSHFTDQYRLLFNTKQKK
jgi:hypothetical protein